MSKKSRARGEMPFLDHLEELRWRILWSLLALIVGTVIGFLIVQHFEVLQLLKKPIAPFLPEGRLFITRPTDAFIITLGRIFLGSLWCLPLYRLRWLPTPVLRIQSP